MFRGSQGGTTRACTAGSETMGPSHDGNLVSLDQQSARVAMVRPDLAAGITETRRSARVERVLLDNCRTGEAREIAGLARY